jgi:hypothetical protein
MSREQEIAALKAKLKARENQPGFKSNVEQIRKRIAELEAVDGD